jgi:hypothetical protein
MEEQSPPTTSFQNFGMSFVIDMSPGLTVSLLFSHALHRVDVRDFHLDLHILFRPLIVLDIMRSN